MKNIRVFFDAWVKIRDLPYETQKSMMLEPFSLPVTRLMSTKHCKEFIDWQINKYSAEGVDVSELGD